MSQKKILFVISSLDMGGAQRAVSNLTTHFPDDWDIDILLNSDEHIVYPYRGKIRSLDVGEPRDRSGLLYQAQVFIRRIRALSRLKKTGRYQACISFLFSANIANIITGNRYCRVVISVRCTLSQMKPTLKRKLIIDQGVKALFNHSDKIVSLSKGTERDLHENYGIDSAKTCVIYNGYDINSIREKADEEEKVPEEGSFVISTMGRLEYQKGQWHLIRCIYHLKSKYPEIRLIILGSGTYKPYLETLIRNGNLENHVRLAGFCHNPFPIIKASSLFVFPSLFEGFGNVLIEAMACGVPCIASDFRSGAREIMAPLTPVERQCTDKVEYAQFGVLTPVCSGNKYSIETPLEKEELLLCQAIEEMIVNKSLRDSYRNRTRQRAAEFSTETAVGQWIQVIEDRKTERKCQ